MPWEIVHKVKENMRPWCTCPKCGNLFFHYLKEKIINTVLIVEKK